MEKDLTYLIKENPFTGKTGVIYYSAQFLDEKGQRIKLNCSPEAFNALLAMPPNSPVKVVLEIVPGWGAKNADLRVASAFAVK